MIYALLAGLHTIQDFDLGWQLATGRWVAQHHQVFSTEVFSYTARGAQWIYPALSGLFFYLIYRIGGYALLSWLGALTCAATVFLLLRRKNPATAALALISVPLIANRTQPRAEMFTTLLFAAFLALLWKHYRPADDRPNEHRPHERLWLLPVLMMFWVNFHPGFIAGIALCGAYLAVELLEMIPAALRAKASSRLKESWQWLALTCVAAIVNPWGVRIYGALIEQEKQQQLHTAWVTEWQNIRPSPAGLHQALAWRDPQSAFWWLLVVSVACFVIALLRKHWGEAILLAGASYLALQHVRFQALFAIVIVVVGGSVLHEVWRSRRQVAAELKKPSKKSAEEVGRNLAWGTAVGLVATALLTTLAGARSWDLISDRYYLQSAQLAEFGSGVSWWFPQRALDFIQREKLPANIFAPYSLGGWMTWRLFPEYSDYIDGRALPFGQELFFRAYDLMAEPPDSATWQTEAAARNINTIIAPLGRYSGISLFPQLPAFCQNQNWRPVYLDEVSAVFVRRTPETAALTDRLQIDCDKAQLAPQRDFASNTPMRNRADAFNFSANAAGVLYALGRYEEAMTYIDRAQAIFSNNANLHLTRALILEQTVHPAEAEKEFRTSLALEPNDETWFDFALFYMTQQRYADAIPMLQRVAESSPRPHDLWMLLGRCYLQLQQPQPALAAFDKAEAASPFADNSEALGANFNSTIATGRARAWYQLGDTDRAVSFQEQAVKLAPNDPKLWLGLADLYVAQGRMTKAAEARSHAGENTSQNPAQSTKSHP